MGYAIPRIQYENLDTTGNTVSGNSVINTVATTTGLIAGMFVRGTGIPAGATVGSFTSNSVTLAGGVQASANGSGVALSFGYEILFDYPPVEDTAEALKANTTVSISLSGIQQTAFNFTEGLRNILFSFVSETTRTQLETFLKNWALQGQQFRYYEDKTLTSFTIYQLKDLSSSPKRRASVGLDIYRYDYPLTFRRVI